MSTDPAVDNPETHWNTVYSQRGDAGVSWYQPSADWSLRLIDQLGIAADAAVVDVGGGASRLVDGLLQRGFTDVSVLDISESALSAARRRVGAASPVTWLHQDVLNWQPARRFQLWHDRALFHFLTDPQDRDRYLEVLGAALQPGGAVVVGTFAQDGPQRCSGLPVRRYAAKHLVESLGGRFRVLQSDREEHTTPAGVVQPFTWLAGRYG